jgi:hypothetical protein
MLLQIGNAAGSHSVETISKAWTEHYDDLRGARGIFVVDDPKHELKLPGDVDFGSTGFLRNLLGSRNLLNIQNVEGARAFRYSAPIFCDTNFVSFCGAFFAGRDLKANKESFREAVEYLLPIKNSISAMAYVLENVDKADTEKMKSSLTGFMALTRAKNSNFVRSSFSCEEQTQLEETVSAALQKVNQTDFRTIRAWVQERYTWSRLILVKATLITFKHPASSIENRMRELFRFLHNEFARFIQFEIYVAFRFFWLNSEEPFFSGIQQNASALEATLNSMAWDLTHWSTILDVTMMDSGAAANTPFPIPHFLSFDRRFVRLIETFKLDGVIYSGNRKRCEQIYARPVLQEISDLLRGPLGEFYTDQAIADRKRRVAESGTILDVRLSVVSEALLQELRDFVDRRRQN